MSARVVTMRDGVAILGNAASGAVVRLALEAAGGRVPLIVADPPYGKIVADEWDHEIELQEAMTEWMIEWTVLWADAALVPGGAFYVWGGTGRPGFRPFFRYLTEIEATGEVAIGNVITWKKKRGFGVQNNYLYTREECVYLVAGDPKKPARFNIPLLDQKRGYAGYSEKYPAKSEFLRRSNVWDESEIFRGKLHVCQKADRVSEVPVEVHTAEGETVIDLFAGSGSTAAAARRLGRRWIAVENDPASFEVLCKRLAD